MKFGIKTGTIFILTLLLAACGTIQTAPTTPLEKAKQAVQTADAVWYTAQRAFATAYLDGKLTENDWGKFRSIDAQVLHAGRLLRDAVRAWEAGIDPSPDRMNKLTAELLSLFSEAYQFAAQLGLIVPNELQGGQ